MKGREDRSANDHAETSKGRDERDVVRQGDITPIELRTRETDATRCDKVQQRHTPNI